MFTTNTRSLLRKVGLAIRQLGDAAKADEYEGKLAEFSDYVQSSPVVQQAMGAIGVSWGEVETGLTDTERHSLRVRCPKMFDYLPSGATEREQGRLVDVASPPGHVPIISLMVNPNNLVVPVDEGAIDPSQLDAFKIACEEIVADKLREPLLAPEGQLGKRIRGLVIRDKPK